MMEALTGVGVYRRFAGEKRLHFFPPSHLYFYIPNVRFIHQIHVATIINQSTAV